MSHYRIIADEPALDAYIASLPDHGRDEVYYVALFGRNKYDPSFPKAKDSSQLARIFAGKEELKTRIRRLEAPLGSYTRDGVAAPQEALALYIGINPRSLIRANKGLLIELAKRFADGDLNFNPVTAATTEVHRAIGTKHYVDFDFDRDGAFDGHLEMIDRVITADSYRVLRTRGGYHVLVSLAKLSKIETIPNDWYRELKRLPGCDVTGSECLMPVPGCTQGGFVPYFLDLG